MIRITRYDSVTRFDLANTLLGRGRYWTTAYLVDGLLVDSGCAHSAAELAQALEGSSLTCIANTHTHEDHIGANGVLQRARGGLELRAHPLALPVLADPRRTQPLHPYRKLFWGWPTPSQATPLADGERIETEHFTFQALYTPGHSADHLCLYEAEQGWLFSGDLFVGGYDRALRAGQDIWQTIASLERMADLPIQRLFPGSARVREQPAQELREKVAYYQERGLAVLELRRQGESVDEIARRLFGGPMWVELVTLGHFSRRNLVRAYLGENQEVPLSST
jgi:glyoxylase-like metal-dependent hydrolase (beta-lactamase superfamily II)